MHPNEAATVDRIYQITKTMVVDRDDDDLQGEVIDHKTISALHLYTLLLRMADGMCLLRDEDLLLRSMSSSETTTKLPISAYPALMKEMETKMEAFITRYRHQLDVSYQGTHYLPLIDAVVVGGSVFMQMGKKEEAIKWGEEKGTRVEQ